MTAVAAQPLTQAWLLARRSIVGLARQPPVFIPAMFFPLLIAAVNAAALQRSTNLPAFPPVDSFLQFLLPATIVQGVLMGGVAGGSDVALDIENGFFERLIASPVSRVSILLGRLAGGAAMGAVQAVVFVLLFLPFGVRIESGVAGVVVLIAMATLLAIAIGGLAAAVGLRTGSQEAVQSFFPLVFILMFISSAFFPTELMNGWYETLATANPMTLMIDGARSLVIDRWTAQEALQAVGVAAAFAAVTVAFATRQLRRRLAVAA